MLLYILILLCILFWWTTKEGFILPNYPHITPPHLRNPTGKLAWQHNPNQLIPYPINPDMDRSCTPADFCGALYHNNDLLPSNKTHYKNVYPRNGIRVGAFST